MITQEQMPSNVSEFGTPWGMRVKSHWREGRNDYNVCISCIVEDEYRLAKLGRIGGVLLDIGAFIGSVSLTAASLGMRPLAVEPIPENVEMCRRNGVKVIHGALAEKTSLDPLRIYYQSGSTENGKHHEFVGNLDGELFPTEPEKNSRWVDVPRYGLNDLIVQASKYDAERRVSLIKLDCEGSEWAGLRGVSAECLSLVDCIMGERHTLANPPGEYSVKDLLALTHGQFKDASAEYLPPAWLQDHFIFVREDG